MFRFFRFKKSATSLIFEKKNNPYKQKAKKGDTAMSDGNNVNNNTKMNNANNSRIRAVHARSAQIRANIVNKNRGLQPQAGNTANNTSSIAIPRIRRFQIQKTRTPIVVSNRRTPTKNNLNLNTNNLVNNQPFPFSDPRLGVFSANINTTPPAFNIRVNSK